MTRARPSTTAGVAALLSGLAAFCAPAMLHAAAVPIPPSITAMWEGEDGAAVRKALHAAVAAGEAGGATARLRIEAGEAAWWLGVQDARASRPDSALAHWRHAMRLRGHFDEGFALVDALCRRGRKADLDEAWRIAGPLAEEARTSLTQRIPEAYARLAWTLHLRGKSDSALVVLRERCANVEPRPLWTRRFVEVRLAARDTAGAWRPLAALSGRTRGRDAATESLLVRAQRALRYSDERRAITVDLVREPIEAGERALLASVGGAPGALAAPDGYTVRWFLAPAADTVARRAPLLFALSPTDTLTAADEMVRTFQRAGHPVVLLVPRGCHGAVGPGVTGPESWAGCEQDWHAAVAADAARVIEHLERTRAVGAPRGSGWLVGAGGSMAPVALELARSRASVAAMLLTAPQLPLVEVAEYRARLRKAGTRTFVQVGPEEPHAMELADLLARATRPGQVRVADSGAHGKGAALFRGDPKVGRRLLAWLAEKPGR
jgi:hypothetical protein